MPGHGFRTVAFECLLRDTTSCPGAQGPLAIGQHEAFVLAARGGPKLKWPKAEPGVLGEPPWGPACLPTGKQRLRDTFSQPSDPGAGGARES